VFIEGEGLGCSGFLRGGTVFVFASMQPGSDWRLRPVYITTMTSHGWTRPRIVPFSSFGPYNFTVGPDDRTVYFTSLKSPDRSTSRLLEEANIWAVQLQGDGWTEPVMFGQSLNTEQHYENYPSVTSDGIVYYMSRRSDSVGRTDVYRSRNLDGVYGTADNIGPPVNTESSDIDPFVAPDESYLIVCQDRPDGHGGWDLHVAYRKHDGSWTDPVNLGDQVNSASSEARPFVTPDGRFLFFTSNRPGNQRLGSIYWVDASVIEANRAKE
jgi:hypothetical protein